MRANKLVIAALAAAVAAIVIPLVALAGSDAEPVSVTSGPRGPADEVPVDVDDAFFDSSQTYLALTTPDGEKVFVSPSKAKGAHCLTVEDTAGAVSTTCAPFNATPVGNAVVQGFQDGKTGKVKLAVLVPDGFNAAIVNGNSVPIQNNAAVLEIPQGVTSFTLEGPAGTETITNFSRLLGALTEAPDQFPEG